MLNELENTLLIEILVNIYQPKKRFYKPVPKNIRKLMKRINIDKYKIIHQDIEIITESLVYLNRSSVEKIFVQTYILLLEWSNNTEVDFSVLSTIFSKLGDSRRNDLRDLVHKYQKGEEIYSRNDIKTIENKTKSKAFKLFNTLKSTDSSKINVTALNKLNKGSLIKVWGKVAKMLKIINSPKIPSHIKTIAIGALLYAIIPVDAIPDYIPVAGLVDDAAVITFAFDQINKLIKSQTHIQ